MSIKNAVLCALLFAAGTADAKGRGRRNKMNKADRSSFKAGFGEFGDVVTTGQKQDFGGQRSGKSRRWGSKSDTGSSFSRSDMIEKFRGGSGDAGDTGSSFSRSDMMEKIRGRGDSFSRSNMMEKIRGRGSFGKGGEGRGGKGHGGKGRGGKGRGGKGYPGVNVLERIEACEDEIILMCSLDFDFELDDLMTNLEALSAAKEQHKEEKQTERAEKHAELVKACPVLAEECGVPQELPTMVEGERPDREAMKAIKDSIKCIIKTPLEEMDDLCAGFINDMQAEREADKPHRDGEKPGRPDKEMIEMLKAVRTCIQDEVKPTLDEASVCMAALTRPEKEEPDEVTVPVEEEVQVKTPFYLN